MPTAKKKKELESSDTTQPAPVRRTPAPLTPLSPAAPAASTALSTVDQNASSTEATSLTVYEIKVVIALLQSMTANPQVDVDKASHLLSHNFKESTECVFGNLFKKFNPEISVTDTSPVLATPAAKKRPRLEDSEGPPAKQQRVHQPSQEDIQAAIATLAVVGRRMMQGN